MAATVAMRIMAERRREREGKDGRQMSKTEGKARRRISECVDGWRRLSAETAHGIERLALYNAAAGDGYEWRRRLALL
jgi:plasmid maintenance system antidote protein VapI